MGIINLILRSISYFRSGFSNYINYPFSLISFGTTFYYLAIQNIPFLKAFFPSFLEFMIFTLLIVYPIGHLFGFLHYKKLLFRTEQDIITESNQYSQQILAPIMVPMYKILLKLGQDGKVDAETLQQIENILKATSIKRPVIREDPTRRRIRRVKSVFTGLRRRLIPKSMLWEHTQREYEKWANTPLPENYLKLVKERGAAFQEFVGSPGTIIDVGCGNGLLSGKTYEEIGYVPLRRGVNTIYGLDPLTLKAPIPWIDQFIQGRCEDPIPVKAEFATFVTSFDHIEDPATGLSRLKDAGVRGVFIWETLSRRRTGGDAAHLKRYTLEELTRVLESSGFFIKRFIVTDDISDWFGCFIEAERK